MWPKPVLEDKESDEEAKCANWYGLAMKPEGIDSKGDETDFVSPVVLVGNRVGKVVKEVKENNNRLVTKVVQRPQTGQVYNRSNTSGSMMNKSGAKIVSKLGKRIQKLQIGQSKKQFLILDSSASELNKTKNSRSVVRLSQPEGLKRGYDQTMTQPEVMLGQSELQTLTHNESI